MRRDWTHYAAPAAFLLAVTIAVVLIRSGLSAGDAASSTTAAIPPPPVRTTVAQTTTRKSPPKPAPRFYTVAAGDTFQVISSKTGVPVARLEALNPNVETTALYIGQKLRIR